MADTAFIKELQRLLSQAGFPIRIDGRDGPETRAAIRAAQGKLGLPVTGMATPATMAALAKPAAPMAPPTPRIRPPGEVMEGGTTAGRSMASPPIPTQRPVVEPLDTAGTTSSAGATAARPPKPNIRGAMAENAGATAENSQMIGSVPFSGFPDAGSAPSDWLAGGNTQAQWPFVPPEQRDQFYSPPLATPSFAGDMVPDLRGAPYKFPAPWLNLGGPPEGDIPPGAMTRERVSNPAMVEAGPPQMPQHLPSRRPPTNVKPDLAWYKDQLAKRGAPQATIDRLMPLYAKALAVPSPAAPAQAGTGLPEGWFPGKTYDDAGTPPPLWLQSGAPADQWAFVPPDQRGQWQGAQQGAQQGFSNPDEFMRSIMQAISEARIEPQPKPWARSDESATPYTPPPFTTPSGPYR